MPLDAEDLPTPRRREAAAAAAILRPRPRRRRRPRAYGGIWGAETAPPPPEEEPEDPCAPARRASPSTTTRALIGDPDSGSVGHGRASPRRPAWARAADPPPPPPNKPATTPSTRAPPEAVPKARPSPKAPKPSPKAQSRRRARPRTRSTTRRSRRPPLGLRLEQDTTPDGRNVVVVVKVTPGHVCRGGVVVGSRLAGVNGNGLLNGPRQGVADHYAVLGRAGKG